MFLYNSSNKNTFKIELHTTLTAKYFLSASDENIILQCTYISPSLVEICTN